MELYEILTNFPHQFFYFCCCKEKKNVYSHYFDEVLPSVLTNFLLHCFFKEIQNLFAHYLINLTNTAFSTLNKKKSIPNCQYASSISYLTILQRFLNKKDFYINLHVNEVLINNLKGI